MNTVIKNCLFNTKCLIDLPVCQSVWQQWVSVQMHVSAEAEVIQTEFCFLVELMVLQLLHRYEEAIYSYQQMITCLISFIFSISKCY